MNRWLAAWAGAPLAFAVLTATATFAAAHAGNFSAFNGCPSRTSGVLKCVRVVATSGEVVLGSQRTRLTRPVILQGGVSATDEAHRFMSRFFGALGAMTLTPESQPLTGGLSRMFSRGRTPPWLETVVDFVSRRGPTEVNATLELAGPASDVAVSEYNLLGEEGVALRLPIMLHLENPLLGSDCSIGTPASPLVWNLTTGAARSPTSEAQAGSAGIVHSAAQHEIVQIESARLVDRGWSTPLASGCGGVLAPLIDPVIDASFGLATSAGTSSVSLTSSIEAATVGSVNAH